MIFKCDICNKDFNNQVGLSVHLTKIHPNRIIKIDPSKIKCLYCDKRFDSENSVIKHAVRMHKITRMQLYLDFNNIEQPVCKCGCKQHTKFITYNKGFNEYILGHSSRIHNNWGHNPKANKKAHITQNQMIEDGTLVAWNKGLTKETDESVVKYAKLLEGRKISNTTKQNMSISKQQYFLNPENRKKHSILKKNYLDNLSPEQYNKVIKNMLHAQSFSSVYTFNTKPELAFFSILDSLNIQYDKQFILKGKIYDVKIVDKDILIEVDGDWYHCNPNKEIEPKHVRQIMTVKNDKLKNQIAKDNGYQLLRFWETDIKQNKQQIIKQLQNL